MAKRKLEESRFHVKLREVPKIGVCNISLSEMAKSDPERFS